jgi:glutamine amidotransferase
MIVIVDYNIGNVLAVQNMLLRIGFSSIISSRVEEINKASRIILPGNGSYDACINNLRISGLIPYLEDKVLNEKVPLLGICVGAQMLGSSSAEGRESGLGWIDMTVERLPQIADFRIPHMGWNNVIKVKQDNEFSNKLPPNSRFYFSHSYYMKPKRDAIDIALLNVSYGIEFTAAVIRQNIIGVQFHPEKSHHYGKVLLKSFAEWKP